MNGYQLFWRGVYFTAFNTIIAQAGTQQDLRARCTQAVDRGRETTHRRKFMPSSLVAYKLGIHTASRHLHHQTSRIILPQSLAGAEILQNLGTSASIHAFICMWNCFLTPSCSVSKFFS